LIGATFVQGRGQRVEKRTVNGNVFSRADGGAECTKKDGRRIPRANRRNAIAGWCSMRAGMTDANGNAFASAREEEIRLREEIGESNYTTL